MKKLLISLSFIAMLMSVYGQTDRLFWFGAPDITDLHGNNPWNGAPINLHITSVLPTTVLIERPGDASFTPITLNFPTALFHVNVPLNTQSGGPLAIGQIETYSSPKAGSGDTVINHQFKGFRITSSPGEITAYYELDNYWNRDIFALKGTNALGREFNISTQNAWRNDTFAYSNTNNGFVICATENNTRVVIYPDHQSFRYFDPPADSIVIMLDMGETWALESTYQSKIGHINGVRVVSDKDIAVTVYDDSLWKWSNTGGSYSRDLMGDQIVPTRLNGQEYIVMKGSIYNSVPPNNATPAQYGGPDGGEKAFITALYNNTAIYIDGALVTTIANAGDVWQLNVDNYTSAAKQWIHLRGSQDIYVNHVTGFGGELGLAVLPTIDGCTGSYDVTITRTNNTNDAFFLNIMIRNDTADGSPTKNQSINLTTITTASGVTTPIPAAYFTYIMDSSWIVFKKDGTTQAFLNGLVGPGDEVRVSNPIAKFHLGMINGGQITGCKYGYFSDYADKQATAGIGGSTSFTSNYYCNLGPVQLVAAGGKSYAWYCYSHPAVTHNLTDTTIADPYFIPDSAGDYIFRVIIEQECYDKDTLQLRVLIVNGPTSDFMIPDPNACSPNSPLIINQSNPILADEIIWDFGYAGAHEVNQDTLPWQFRWPFPPNTSDTIQEYAITLYTWGPMGSCPNERTKHVKILPLVIADFMASDTIGCHPLPVDFTNLSTGHLDSTSYFWNFGDNSQSFEENPSKYYSNFNSENDTFIVTLMVESPLGCRDTADQTIVVHPRVRASMIVPISYACSPLLTNLYPTNSIGADTIKWYVSFPTFDSVDIRTNLTSFQINHRDTTFVNGPDTIRAYLIAKNRMDCADTTDVSRMIIYPEVVTSFIPDRTEICDSMPINFTNTSVGYHLFHTWDFDDGTSYLDTTGGPVLNKYFVNRSDADVIYNVTLTSISEFACQSSYDTNILVHPYINANFGINYVSNCTPLDAIITNLSIRAHIYQWDLGDGFTTSTSAGWFAHQFWNPSPDNDTTYFISLRVENFEGCADSIVRPITLFPQVVAVFTMEDSVGCSPLTTTFHNNSTGGLLSYLWNFGNSTSGTNTTPDFTKIYTNLSQHDTIYYVTLTATNPYGCDSAVGSQVEVFADIDADFSLPITDSCSPFTIRPRNLSSSGANFFEWDFGYLGSSTVRDPVLPPYINQTLILDTIDVRLIAFGQNDMAHRACADTNTIRVVVFPELDAQFVIDTAPQCQPFHSPITNNTNITTNTVFQWRLDGNFYSSAVHPGDLVVGNLGDFSASHILMLTGMTQYGCRDTAMHSFIVNPLVDAKFSIDKSTMCSGDSVYIDRATSRGGITEYFWDFNGESTSNTPVEQFYQPLFNSTTIPESKYIALRVTNLENGLTCDSTWVQYITVFPAVDASFTFDDQTVCYPHLTYITNNTVNASNYLWYFGDGANSTANNPIHLFQNFDKVNDQTFTVRVIARSDYNCYDSATGDITVYAKPMADFNFPVTVDCPPFTADMVNASMGANLTYQWDFAGESTSTIENPSYEFNNEGSTIESKLITLVVTSQRGCMDTTFKSLNVYPGVAVNFIQSINEGCSPLNVEFTAEATNASKVVWYVNGNPFSTLFEDSYRFENPTDQDLVFEIKFEASSIYNCVDSSIREITVFPSPTAYFIPEPRVQMYDTEDEQTDVTFYNQTGYRNAWDYEWSFGDGTTSDQNDADFVHTYPPYFWGDNNDQNRIPIQLIAWNGDNPQCRDTALYSIVIQPPVPIVYLPPDIEGCEPLTIDLSAYTEYADGNGFQWYFTDDHTTSTDTNPTHTFENWGTYEIELIVRGDGGENRDYMRVTVNPKPIAQFSYNDSIVFDSNQTKGYDEINFYNQTQFGDDYSWYFDADNFYTGGSEDSDEEDPVWHYNDTGTYYVVLVASSGENCVDTFIHPTPIRVLGEGYIRFPTGFFVDPSGAADPMGTDRDEGNLYLFYAASRGVAEYKLDVYNRWGVLVFHTDNVNEGWNGYYKGVSSPQDVYIWRARGQFTNGQPFDYAGDVTLLRGVVNLNIE